MTRGGDRESRECCEEGKPVVLANRDELAVRLRELAFGALLASAHPVEPSTLARLVGAGKRDIATALEDLAGDGLIDRDAQGRVLGARGLTLGDGPHGLVIDGHAFRTWCAFDALGIPGALGTDAQVRTACGVCRREIEIDLRDGLPSWTSSAVLWLSAGGANMRADFCTPTVLLCSPAHAEVWAERHGGRGRALTLAEAFALGARDWASAASTAAELAGGLIHSR